MDPRRPRAPAPTVFPGDEPFWEAAREGRPIGMDQLERAAKAEYVDRGSLTVGGRLA